MMLSNARQHHLGQKSLYIFFNLENILSRNYKLSIIYTKFINTQVLNNTAIWKQKIKSHTYLAVRMQTLQGDMIQNFCFSFIKGLSKGCKIRCRSYTNYFEGATQVHGQVWPFFGFQIEWLLHDFLQLI